MNNQWHLCNHYHDLFSKLFHYPQTNSVTIKNRNMSLTRTRVNGGGGGGVRNCSAWIPCLPSKSTLPLFHSWRADLCGLHSVKSLRCLCFGLADGSDPKGGTSRIKVRIFIPWLRLAEAVFCSPWLQPQQGIPLPAPIVTTPSFCFSGLGVVTASCNVNPLGPIPGRFP